MVRAIDGEMSNRLVYAGIHTWPSLEQCPECAVKLEGAHHWGCSFEVCPRCYESPSTCECRWIVL
jgi:hypothetical protein